MLGSNLPTFIGIGGHKCATTWLSECMREHPDVFMSEPKELGFFSWRFDKGMYWYLRHFNNTERYRQKGEFTSHYLYDPEVPSRIHDSVENVKLLAVVRDPVNRALSQIKYGIRHGFIKAPTRVEISLGELHQMIAQYPEIIERSLYATGLDRFSKLMGKEMLLVFDQIDCKQKPMVVLRRVWDFLEVDNEFVPSRAEKNVSRGIVPRWQFLETMRKNIFYIANRNMPRLITIVRRLRIAELYRKLNEGKSICFDESCQEYLESFFRDDWARTQAYVWSEE